MRVPKQEHLSQALKDAWNLPSKGGGVGGLEVKEKSVLKKRKCQNAQVTEAMGLRARSRSELGAGERLWSDHNGPSVPPK